MKPPVTSDCSLAPKLLFVDWLKMLANEKQAVQFPSPFVLVCEQKRCSHMPGVFVFFSRIKKHQACVNTVFVHKLKQKGMEIALLVSHWLTFLTNQQTKVLAPNYNPK